MRAIGFPLYVNGSLFQQPVTISHVPGPGVQGILKGFGVDPSMGGLGSYATYQPTRGMPRGVGEDQAVVVSPPVVVAAPSSTLAFPKPTLGEVLLGLVGLASTVGLVYHGYKRNQSIGWAIGWGLLGGIAPIVAWPVAVAQGYAKPKTLTPNRRRLRRNGKPAKAKTKATAKAKTKATVKATAKKPPTVTKRVSYIETYLDKERGPAWRLKAGITPNRARRLRRRRGRA